MKKIVYIIASFLLAQVTLVTAAQKTWIAINNDNPAPCKPVLISSTGTISEIRFNLPGFYIEERITPHGLAYSVSVPDAAKMLQSGNPDLPQLTFSLAIGDNVEMKSEITSSNYVDYNFSIAPSKGNLKRNINPGDVPYTYGNSYSTNAFYPTTLSTLRDPYILRDVRGQVVVVYPFTYNPVTQTLRVYTSLTIKITPTGNTSTKNILTRRNTAIDPTFTQIYRHQFLNSNALTYLPVSEYGNMLVIADHALLSATQPFVDWKNKMGLSTEMVDVSTIGNTPTAIKTFIENYYNTNGLTFVLLVGDGPQIPPYPSQYGDSDPSYGYITGNDSYAEVIVGRFSANNSSELITQVQRSIQYELHPDPAGQWYHKAVCIGSDQGPGDDNEMDFEHERNIRADLMAYNYTNADELYDGTEGGVDDSGDPVAGDLIASLDNGKSIVTYTGHGSSASLGTTGFSSTDVTSLNNFDELPFIFSVACVNGDFNNNTCLAEALMRSTGQSGNKATGAIAALMSTINQSWDPPMDGQDEMIDILVESIPGNIKHTFGGISVNGCMHMNDQYGADGDEMTDTWTIFGDPSLMIRTNTPVPLSVTHTPLIDYNATTYLVGCTQNQALVCLSHHAQIISTGWSLAGNASLNIPASLTVGDTLDLVVTAYNAIPFISQIVVTNSPTGISNVSSKPYSFYPNPARNNLHFVLSQGLEKLSLKIINAEGQIVLLTNTLDENVDISSLSSGLYSILVSDDNGFISSEKIIVE